MIERIDTPLGPIELWLDGSPCAHDGTWEVFGCSDYAKSHPVDGNMRIAYWHEPDDADHVLECRLEPVHACSGCGAPGERLEATEIRDGRSELVIAVEYDCGEYAQGHGEHEYDYRAFADGLTATVNLPADAKAQWIVFGVSWVNEATEDNEANPWLLGDPIGDRLRLPTGVYRKDGSGPYGGRTIEWFLPIERPWERKEDLLALFDGCETVEHTNAEEGYERLYDEEVAVDIANPHGGKGIWMEVGSEFTLGIGGWHAHYDSYEGDYHMLKDDISSILSGGMRFAVAFVGENRWRGSHVLEASLPDDANGWDVLRPMGLPHEFMEEFAEHGGTVEIVSWLPERCKTLRIEEKA